MPIPEWSLPWTLNILENEQVSVTGELLADGRASPIEYGFILTSTDRNSTLYTVAADENGSKGEEFSKVVGDLDRGKSYVYQAYVKKRTGNGHRADEMDPGISGIGLTGNLTGSGSTGGRLVYLLDGRFLDGRREKMAVPPEPRLDIPFGRRAGGSMDLAGARWVAMDDTRCVAVPLESAKY